MMSLILTLFILAAGGLGLAFVLAPLRHPEQALTGDPSGPPADRSSGGLQSLLEQREAALAGLAELDFDRTIGNLSDTDYEHLRGQYRAQAIGVLKAVDAQVGRVALQPDTVKSATAAQPARPSARLAAAPPLTEKPVSPRGLRVMSGVIGAALLSIALLTFMLRERAATSAGDAPALNVLHAHAALLVPGTQVALVGHHNGLLRSSDEGRTWQKVAMVKGDVLSVVGAAQGQTLYLTTSRAIQRSSDLGATWGEIPLPRSNAQVSVLAVDGAQPNSLYAVVPDTGIFRTVNSRDWELVGAGLPPDVTALVWLPAPVSGWYASSPTEGVLASGDGGKTWGSANGVLNGVLPITPVRTLAFDPQSGDQFTAPDGSVLQGTLYTGTDMGLFKSIDGGSSWAVLPLREPLAAIGARASPSALLLVVDSRGRVWRSSDAGGSWNAGP